jgi:Tfp pilus assembly protein PilF
MKPASSRTVARYVVCVTILAAANEGANVGAHFSASLAAAGTEHSASSSGTQPTPESQSTSPVQSQKQKLSNPLNDLLDEAQRDIDKNDFEAAIPPLQKFLAEKPDVAWAHFQLAYAYTALKRVPEARAEYEHAIALDPKMSEAYLNLGILLMEPNRCRRRTAA